MESQKAKDEACSKFVAYLESKVDLDKLANLRKTLDEELENSRRTMAEINRMFDTVPMQSQKNLDNSLQHEKLSKFLEADVPNLLLPDMVKKTSTDIDIDNDISKMRGNAEEIKRNIPVVSPKPQVLNKEEMKSFDLEQYAHSLDEVSKKLAKMKLNQEDGNRRDPQLEDRLEQLCLDVHMFTQMVKTNTKLSECNDNWKECQMNGSAFQYEDTINKLLAGINQVTYLLKTNKN